MLWKTWSNLRYYDSICLECMRKKRNHDSRRPSRESNRLSPENKAEIFPLEQSCFVALLKEDPTAHRVCFVDRPVRSYVA
jgi:hypothetical protein